jgi:hypothetical protein
MRLRQRRAEPIAPAGAPTLDKMSHFVDISKAPLPICRRVSGAEAVSFAPIKKLPTSRERGPVEYSGYGAWQ